MSWIDKLYRTYEANEHRIGDPDDFSPLLPICHTTQNAQVHVVINKNGEFIRASVIPKNEARTIIPATEESAGRTSGPVPHPLCDKLQYVAGDYTKYGGHKTSQVKCYCDNLEDWCSSPYSHPKAEAILSYIRKESLIQDLISQGILHLNDLGTLLDKWSGQTNETPEIFKVTQSAGGQNDAFVRFSVEIPGEAQSSVWTDKSLWQSWIDYYASKKSDKGLCYVTGEELLLAKQHPKNIRRGGDGAKLISSNDAAGYTYRGRFTSSDEACGVSFVVTQKVHSALRWLIARQGHRSGDMAIVAWAVSGIDIPDPLADSLTLLLGGLDESSQQVSYTADEIGIQLSKRLAGYSVHLGNTDEVVVMALDSATPGRMAISFYRELTGSELLARVQTWHKSCCWHQRFGKERVFVGAPAPRDIAETAYGTRLDDKLKNATVERLIPCIVDGVPIPHDLVESCVRRASSRQGIEPWEWEKALGIACALFRYQNNERNYAMSLERDRTTRDYLYGRLLALADHLEDRALYVGGEKRETNAAKLMQRFAERPYSTWLTIETSLSPYRARLVSKRSSFLHYIELEIDEICNIFTTDDFVSDRRLTGEFLLGYHCQRAALHEKPSENSDDIDNNLDSSSDDTE